jgi:hypothetical protein
MKKAYRILKSFQKNNPTAIFITDISLNAILKLTKSSKLKHPISKQLKSMKQIA